MGLPILSARSERRVMEVSTPHITPSEQMETYLFYCPHTQLCADQNVCIVIQVEKRE